MGKLASSLWDQPFCLGIDQLFSFGSWKCIIIACTLLEVSFVERLYVSTVSSLKGTTFISRLAVFAASSPCVHASCKYSLHSVRIIIIIIYNYYYLNLYIILKTISPKSTNLVSGRGSTNTENEDIVLPRDWFSLLVAMVTILQDEHWKLVYSGKEF